MQSKSCNWRVILNEINDSPSNIPPPLPKKKKLLYALNGLRCWNLEESERLKLTDRPNLETPNFPNCIFSDQKKYVHTSNFLTNVLFELEYVRV